MIQVETLDREVVVRVHGDLDDVNIAQLVAVFDSAGDRSDRRFAIDLRSCDYINSAVIGSLIRISRRFPNAFEVLIRPSGAVHMIFDVCGFVGNDTFVRVVPDDFSTERLERDAG